jgi:3-deoxy-manno-octulosonate cytidylyltransferase (CMP-KDO synthetase)
MTFLGIIPARYASTRFPGKPLALIGGKPMIQRVYEQVRNTLDDVCVATDDERIADAVRSFGGKAVMTPADCKSGTDRCHAAYAQLGKAYDVVINIQGDEPFIKPAQINTLRACFTNEVSLATLVKPFVPADGLEALLNSNSPKVVVGADCRALYFSRSVVPYLRGIPQTEWLARHTFYKHIGIYGYRPQTLEYITSLPQSPLELAESLEQLRWLEAGIPIRVGFTDIETIGIDTPEDLVKAEEFLHRVAANEIACPPTSS